MFQRRRHVIALLVALTACGDDLPDGVLASTGDGGDTSSSSGDGPDETADETGDPENPVADGAPCDFDEEIGNDYDFEPPEAQEATLNGLNDCNFENILENDSNHLFDDDEIQLWIYHPQDANGDWPDDHPPFPVVFMSPGGGHEVYDDSPPARNQPTSLPAHVRGTRASGLRRYRDRAGRCLLELWTTSSRSRMCDDLGSRGHESLAPLGGRHGNSGA